MDPQTLFDHPNILATQDIFLHACGDLPRKYTCFLPAGAGSYHPMKAIKITPPRDAGDGRLPYA